MSGAQAAARHVLHIVDSLGLGGAQTILKLYFERCGDSQRDMHLYALRTVAREVRIARPNVAVHASPARFSFAPLGALRRIVRDRGIDVLHCHLFRSQVMGYLLKLLFFPRIALVFHEHGRVVGREGESRLEAWLFRQFLRVAAPSVDRFICISGLTRERLLAIVPGVAERTSVIANPVPVLPLADAPVDRTAMRREHGVPEGAFVVGFASRLVERKGWADFLDAFARVASDTPAHFLLAGDGEDLEAASARVSRLGIERRGRLLGHVSAMERFYGSLDCFVMPSHWEPMGLSHLEAQGFGVPVVVSRVPGLSETVHEDVDALLFEARDVEGLAKAIRRLATDAALRVRLAAAGVANAAKYSIDAFSAGLEDAYAQAARRGA